MNMIQIIRATAIATAVAVTLTTPSARASIFGDDNRVDVVSPSAVAGLGQATAIGVNVGLETVKPNGRVDLYTDPMTDHVCADQRFSNQRSLSYNCSAFLIAPDILITAGHCQVFKGEVRNEPEMFCKVFDWLFDFQVDEKGETRTKDVPLDRFYHCKRTIYAISEDKAPFRDFAIVQLDRPVVGRKPLALARNPVNLGEPVSMIGYPMGMPMKYTDHARVLLNDASAMAFVTNLDAFDGNSGSAVFNARNEVVGILVSGTPSQGKAPVPGRQCDQYNRCDDNGENCLLPDTDPRMRLPGFQVVGSDVQRIAPVIEALKAAGIAGF